MSRASSGKRQSRDRGPAPRRSSPAPPAGDSRALGAVPRSGPCTWAVRRACLASRVRSRVPGLGNRISVVNVFSRCILWTGVLSLSTVTLR